MAEKSAKNANISKEDALKYYQMMVEIRRFEEKCGQIYGMGQIAGFCHLTIGQEAISAGLKYCTKDGDAIITSYRCHGNNIAAGTDMKYIMAELMGRETGVSKGKGGSMHLFDIDRGFFGGHGIVGAQMPLGTGIAFAQKYKNTDNICIALCGDGAVNQGQVYEAFNMAKLWDLPVLYIVENNKYAMGTSVARHTKTKHLYKRGLGFEIDGFEADGMDLLNVIEKVSECIEKIRKGHGPILLEMDTYRYRGHSMSDPAKYRDKDEVSKFREVRDPITHFEKFLKSKKWIKDEEIEAIENKTKERVEAAYEFCLASNVPDISELHTQVYCG